MACASYHGEVPYDLPNGYWQSKGNLFNCHHFVAYGICRPGDLNGTFWDLSEDEQLAMLFPSCGAKHVWV